MSNLAKVVYQALDNAFSNGYANFVCKAPLSEVAEDLLSYDADLAGARAEDLIPHIEVWRKNGMGM